MANFFKNIFKKCASVLLFVARVIVVLIWAAICLVGFVTGLVWYPIYVLCAPEACANAATQDGRGNPIDFCPWAMWHALRWFYTPFIAMLPMKYCAEFIRYGKKKLGDYPTKTQVAYYNNMGDDGKQTLLGHGDLSQEALDKIWELGEYAHWVSSDRKLTIQQVRELLVCSTESVVWEYFRKNTPDKEVWAEIIACVDAGNALATRIALRLIKQQRPNRELLNKLLSIKRKEFVAEVEAVMSVYADLDAVADNGDDAEALERWTNFCENRQRICASAQKKMSHSQYLVYAQTGHKLDDKVLRYLLLNINDRAYLRSIIENEFESLKDDCLRAALEVEYWRYSTYLAVKKERESGVGHV